MEVRLLIAGAIAYFIYTYLGYYFALAEYLLQQTFKWMYF